MNAIAMTSLIAGVITCGGLALSVWLHGQSAVQISQLNDLGLTRRVRALALGSRLVGQRADRSEVVIKVEGSSRGRGGGDD